MEGAFHVVYPGLVLQRFREMCRAAKVNAILGEVEHAIQVIDDQLRQQPREFGDPCFPLSKMQADVYVRAISPLVVYYAVHRTKPIVFVKSIEWGTGHGGE